MSFQISILTNTDIHFVIKRPSLEIPSQKKFLEMQLRSDKKVPREKRPIKTTNSQSLMVAEAILLGF